MSNPITTPRGSGRSTMQWLKDNWPSVFARLDAAPEHKWPHIRNYRDGEWAKKRPTRSGRVP